MDPERWQQIRQIFAQVADKSPSHRADFLEMVCDGDTQLQQELQALLLAHDSIAEAPEAEQAMPTEVGDYVPQEQLGAGGMGVVYRANHPLHGQVALKLLPRQVVADSLAQQRFQAEADALGLIQHPALCRLFDAFVTDSYAVLAMDIVEGHEVAELVEGGGLPLPVVLSVATKLSAALSLAHKQGIVHRDIKPTNVLLGANGVVKLIDFGIAKFADRKLTATGQVLGTPSYMSPEQWRGQPLDERTDLWSLGTLVYEMLTGQVAFAGDGLGATAKLILEGEPAPLPKVSVGGAALAPLREILHALLQKDPGKRPASSQELHQRLTKITPERTD